MSNGNVHSAATVGLALGIGLGYGVHYLDPSPVSLGLTIAGTFTGVLISPDQDVDAGNISDYYARKVGLGWLWGIFWKPYRLAFKHRGFLSHGPVISTALRLVYLVFPILIVLLKDDRDKSYFQVLLPAIISQIMALPLLWLGWFFWYHIIAYGVYFVIGLVGADILHYLFDKI